MILAEGTMTAQYFCPRAALTPFSDRKIRYNKNSKLISVLRKLVLSSFLCVQQFNCLES